MWFNIFNLQRLSSVGPVLSCVKTGDGRDRYDFHLELARGTEKDMGLRLTLRVLKEGGKEVLWGTQASKENDWADWQLDFSKTGNRPELKIAKNASTGMTSYDEWGSCDTPEIVLNSETGSHYRRDVTASAMKFEVKRDSCKWGFGYTECDVKFTSSIRKARLSFKNIFLFNLLSLKLLLRYC